MDKPKKVSLLKEIPEDVVNMFGPSLVDAYSVMPIGLVTEKNGKDGKPEGMHSPPAIEVAFGEGTLEGDITEIIDDIQFMVGRRIIPVYAPQREIDLAIEKYYGVFLRRVNRDNDMLYAGECMRKE